VKIWRAGPGADDVPMRLSAPYLDGTSLALSGGMPTSTRSRGRNHGPAERPARASRPSGQPSNGEADAGAHSTRTKRARTTGEGFERLAHAATVYAGSTTTFMLAVGIVVLWIVSGPVFGFSDTWQLVINTGTTIVTFLMVFLIQRTQNKDSIALQLKLNEIVAAHEGASNRLIGVEDLSEEELTILHTYYGELARIAKESGHLTDSHSVEEAAERALSKARRAQRDR
jgi:low affinity Fe/Cu permease